MPWSCSATGSGSAVSGGRADILGQAVELSGVKYTVVGVAPAGFTGMVPGLESQFWAPVMMVDPASTFQGIQSQADHDPAATRIQRRGDRWLFVKGRLAEGKSVEQARAQVDTIFARLRQDYPVTNEKTRASLLPGAGVRFHPMLDGYVKAASAVLLVAVGLVLTIACANVAKHAAGAGGLPPTRAGRARGHRRRDVGRLVRQLLTESLVLAFAGGAAGVVLAARGRPHPQRTEHGLAARPLHFDFPPRRAPCSRSRRGLAA
jgi:hypothetical protein